MAEVFHESESDQFWIESSSSEDEQEDESESPSSDEEGDDRGEVEEQGEVREDGDVREEGWVREDGEVREEGDELPDVEVDENNSTEVNKSNLENAKKHVAVKPQAKIPKWNN